MYSTVYIDSMMEQRRTADLNRRLEYRRVAEERGTMKPARLGLLARVGSALSVRRVRRQATRAHITRHA